MATRSNIGILNSDGTVTSIHCHFDGYPEHNGAILSEYYTDEKKVEELISNGNLRSLGRNINPDPANEHTSDKPQKDVCIYTYRDMGVGTPWSAVEPLVSANIEEWVKSVDGLWIEYMYLFKNGSWFLLSNSDTKCQWKPLKKNADLTKEEIIEKAIKMCNQLIDQYDNNRDITDIDICYLIDTLRGITDGRHCYECGIEDFESGYVINDGEEYYCSDKCLYANYSEDTYMEMHEEGTAYWTQWDKE